MIICCVGTDLSSQSVARQVFSALMSLTSVFGMGTGGPSPLETPTAFGLYQILCTLSRSLRMIAHPQGVGTPSGTRTLDTLIKSQVLYQLS